MHAPDQSYDLVSAKLLATNEVFVLPEKTLRSPDGLLLGTELLVHLVELTEQNFLHVLGNNRFRHY